MKIFKRGSMMQEHRKQPAKQAIKAEDSWKSTILHILKCFEKLMKQILM
jgi:hypothetical protein